MLVLALVALLQQDAPVLDVPAWRDSALAVTLPRPFDDWTFAPDRSRGTVTVIFQPRAGSLSDQLWGALVLTPWDGPLRIGQVADRRISQTWRPQLGSTFTLRSRDSLLVDGFPAIHVVMSGVISHAVLDVEEYLIARGKDLVALQFRYPRGQPHDSVAAGYARTLRGLSLRGADAAPMPATMSSAPFATRPPPAAPASSAARGRPPRAVTPVVGTWMAAIDRGQFVIDVPAAQRAVAPGLLTAELVADGRRVVRFSPVFTEPDTSLYAVGRFRVETSRFGRLTIRAWRIESGASPATPVSDSLVAILATAWQAWWTDFGPVPTTELTLVETTWPETIGGPAIIFLGADAGSPFVLRRELARTWWGGVVRETGAARGLVAALAEWSARSLGGDDASSGPAASPPDVAAIDEARQLAGDARFREAVRTLLVESRGGEPAVDAFLGVLGDTAAAPIRTILK